MIIGITTAGIQAPIVNLETSTTSRTMKVATAPVLFMASPQRQPGSRSRQWWTTIPDWESVKAMNTPTA